MELADSSVKRDIFQSKEFKQSNSQSNLPVFPEIEGRYKNRSRDVSVASQGTDKNASPKYVTENNLVSRTDDDSSDLNISRNNNNQTIVEIVSPKTANSGGQ